jgi:DNA repair exonuclease SbcCD ATPase subunit
MINAQEWLNENYPEKIREKTIILNLKLKDLEGALDLSDFVNLEELNCSYNELNGLRLNKCAKLTKINCSFNSFDNVVFLAELPNPEKLIELDTEDCCGIFGFSEEVFEALVPFINSLVPKEKKRMEEIINKKKDIEIKGKIKDLESKNEELVSQLALAQKEIGDLCRQNGELQTQLQKNKESWENEKEELNKELERFQEENTKLRNELAQKEKTVQDKLEQQIQEQIQKKEKEDEKLKEFLRKEVNLQKRIKIKKDKGEESVSQLETDLKNIQEEIEKRKKELKSEIQSQIIQIEPRNNF